MIIHHMDYTIYKWEFIAINTIVVIHIFLSIRTFDIFCIKSSNYIEVTLLLCIPSADR